MPARDQSIKLHQITYTDGGICLPISCGSRGTFSLDPLLCESVFFPEVFSQHMTCMACGVERYRFHSHTRLGVFSFVSTSVFLHQEGVWQHELGVYLHAYREGRVLIWPCIHMKGT